MKETNKNDFKFLPFGETEEGLLNYLNSKLKSSTVKRYLYDINKFINSFSSALRNPQNATYNDVLSYLKTLQASTMNGRSVTRNLMAIKQYYNYLLSINKITIHPCKDLYLRNGKHKSLPVLNLLNEQELEELLKKRKDRYQEQITRNKLIVSFLIYQGLTPGELLNVSWEYVNLEKGSVYIGSGAKSNARELSLKAIQIHLLYQFSKGEIPTKGKLLTIDYDTIKVVLRHYKKQGWAKHITAGIIRSSVITNWLKSGLDLRTVQYMAGHRYVSATERYEQSKLEELKNSIDKFHPLG